MTVIGEAPLVDVYKIDSSTNIVPEQIKELPVANREFEKLAFIAPGVERERGEFRFVTGGPVIGSGGNASQSTILVDGVDYTDPALGLAKTRVSQDAISEFRVVNSRFDAEVGGSVGRRADDPHEDRDERVQGLRLRASTGRTGSARRAPSRRTRPSTSAAASTASRSAGRSSRTGPTSSSRPSTSTTVRPTLVRPAGRLRSAGRGPEDPFNQILAFGSVTHSLTDSQSLLLKVDYERYREDNFRVGGVQDVSYGQELQRDNYNFTARPHLGRRRRDDERAPGAVRPPEVLRADELGRRRRLVLERRDAEDRRQHPRRTSSAKGTSSRSATRSTSTSRGRAGRTT